MEYAQDIIKLNIILQSCSNNGQDDVLASRLTNIAKKEYQAGLNELRLDKKHVIYKKDVESYKDIEESMKYIEDMKKLIEACKKVAFGRMDMRQLKCLKFHKGKVILDNCKDIELIIESMKNLPLSEDIITNIDETDALALLYPTTVIDIAPLQKDLLSYTMGKVNKYAALKAHFQSSKGKYYICKEAEDVVVEFTELKEKHKAKVKKITGYIFSIILDVIFMGGFSFLLFTYGFTNLFKAFTTSQLSPYIFLLLFLGVQLVLYFILAMGRKIKKKIYPRVLKAEIFVYIPAVLLNLFLFYLNFIRVKDEAIFPSNLFFLTMDPFGYNNESYYLTTIIILLPMVFDFAISFLCKFAGYTTRYLQLTISSMLFLFIIKLFPLTKDNSANLIFDLVMGVSYIVVSVLKLKIFRSRKYQYA